MNDEQKRPQIEPLELNRETIQDLTDSETEGAQGGYWARAPGSRDCPTYICNLGKDTVWECSMEYCTRAPGCV